MADLLALSARYIDGGIYEGPESVNRPSTELSVVAEGVAVIEAFSHVVALESGDGLVLFDVSLEPMGPMCLASLRKWSTSRVSVIAYTHGHIDHVGGAHAFVDEARASGAPTPRILAHENVLARFERYRDTNGYNAVINERQFGRMLGDRGMSNVGRTFGPARWIAPTETFRDALDLRVGDLAIHVRHGKGETDDHLWAWIPAHRALCVGDFIIWNFPNAGNPQKVQRFPLEWARTLRTMAALQPELLLPAHGLPVGGRERVLAVLEDTASALESIVRDVVALMNEGATLDRILEEVKAPPELLEKPYLRPMYDEPEFVVRNTWRLYGGSWDGNPARLLPAHDGAVAREVAALVGGAGRLARRAAELSDAGDHRLSCHLAELAVGAEPENREAHAVRAAVYRARRTLETSLMAKGIFRSAAAESEKVRRPD